MEIRDWAARRAISKRIVGSGRLFPLTPVRRRHRARAYRLPRRLGRFAGGLGLSSLLVVVVG